MNLRNKKRLIAKVLKVGIDRVILDSERRDEIKEIITRQDVRDLRKQGVIRIREIRGRMKKERRKKKKMAGGVKKKVVRRKQEYVRQTRKLRRYIKNLRKKNEITREEYYDLRKKIRARTFRDLSHLKEQLRSRK